MPASTKARQALSTVIAAHLERHRRAGVAYEQSDRGLIVYLDGRAHELALGGGPQALDAALAELAAVGALR